MSRGFMSRSRRSSSFFFFTDPATTAIYTLSLHDALPICPEVVKTVTGEEVSFEQLGGAHTHASRSGVAHFTAADERALIQDCRYLLSFLPGWNGEQPPWEPPDDPVDREDAELDRLIPDESA